jgi:hypothetical protein
MTPQHRALAALIIAVVLCIAGHPVAAVALGCAWAAWEGRGQR